MNSTEGYDDVAHGLVSSLDVINHLKTRLPVHNVHVAFRVMPFPSRETLVAVPRGGLPR